MEGLLDEGKLNKKLVYDKVLKAYFDPSTQEYFALDNWSLICII